MVTMLKVRQLFKPVLVLVAIAAAACVDSGLPGKNLPIDEARNRLPAYNTYDASLDIEPVHFEGRDWMAAGPASPIAMNLLEAVVMGEREVYVLATDEAPYGRLYLRTANGFTPLAPAPLAGNPPPAETAEHH